MKSCKVVMAAVGLCVMLLATSCRKEAIQQDAGLLAKTEKAANHTAARSGEGQPTTFPDLEAFLSYFQEVHYQGYEATITHGEGGQIVITGTTETGNPPTPAEKKHDIETGSLTEFLRWLIDKIFFEGKVVTVGYNKETDTFWGDIK